MDTKDFSPKCLFSPSQQWMYGVLLCILMAMSTVQGKCPPDAKDKAKKCTEMLGFDFSAFKPQEFIADGSADKAVHACGNGDFLDVVSCLERVADECADATTDAAHYLRSMINSTQARNSIKYFCSNVQVYVRNADCIAKHQNTTAECVNESLQRFITQIQANDNMDVQMRFSCSLFWKSVNCTEKSAMKCSGGAADIVRTVMGGFEPPICSKLTGYRHVTGSLGSEEGSQNGNNTSVALSCFLVIICSLILSSIV